VKLSLLFPIGALVGGATTRCWLRVLGDAAATPPPLQARWQLVTGAYSVPSEQAGTVLGAFDEPGVDVELELTAPLQSGLYRLEFILDDVVGSPPSAALAVHAAIVDAAQVREHLLTNTMPLSYAWGVDRGLPVHRLHLEQFLARHAGDIRGRCLEFQEPRYVPRFGGTAVRSIDVLHLDATNPAATVVADLTKPNELASDRFDCIVCTHVLQSIFDVSRAVAELHRILAPGGVLLLAEPQIAMCDSRYDELWRFTTSGLTRLLTTVFSPEAVDVQGFGNSLTAAGELRGLVAGEFAAGILEHHDPRFAAELCARAVKSPE
jgi:hypothetical protein